LFIPNIRNETIRPIATRANESDLTR